MELSRLKNADPEVRIEALRAVQTSIDPRLPEVMLGLLADEGNSIRRLAARGVGSRWWQIPPERVPVYLKALRRNEKSEFDDEVNMVRRGVGLLRREYAGPMFARSASGRWVIYERFGLPCLIDTSSSTEELLGWSGEDSGSLDAAWGNGTLEHSVFWHEKKEIAAMSMLMNRRENAVWVWRHQSPLRKLGVAQVAKVLGLRQDDIFSPGGFYTEIKGWKGDELRFEASFTTERKGQQVDHMVVLGWNAAKDALRVISK